jgi:HPt (histidine-containing phosphotransfer) domain-containing protein
MIEATQTALDAVASPPLVPGDRPIDLVHLSRMTLGDRALERDVLVLFERQIGLLMERIENAAGPVAAAAAHTLKGSARGIGAFALAKAAAEVEEAAACGDSVGRAEGTDHLRAAIREARAEIAGLLTPAIAASSLSRPVPDGRPIFLQASGTVHRRTRRVRIATCDRTTNLTPLRP